MIFINKGTKWLAAGLGAVVLICGGSFFYQKQHFNRNIEIKVRLNRKEAEALNKRVKKSRLSREAYLRHLISGVVPQDAPPPDYFDFMRELHGVGNNLNQIAQKAHVLGVIDERRYDEEMRKFDQLVRDITKAVILPRPIE